MLIRQKLLLLFCLSTWEYDFLNAIYLPGATPTKPPYVKTIWRRIALQPDQMVEPILMHHNYSRVTVTRQNYQNPTYTINTQTIQTQHIPQNEDQQHVEQHINCQNHRHCHTQKFEQGEQIPQPSQPYYSQQSSNFDQVVDRQPKTYETSESRTYEQRIPYESNHRKPDQEYTYTHSNPHQETLRQLAQSQKLSQNTYQNLAHRRTTAQQQQQHFQSNQNSNHGNQYHQQTSTYQVDPGVSHLPPLEREINVFDFHYPPRPDEVYPFNKDQKPYTNMAFEKCPKNFTGQVVYLWSCSEFLNCWKGRGFIQNCAPGTLFNPETLECDFPYKVNCIAGTHSQKVRAKKHDESGNKTLCQPNFTGLLPYPDDCTKFVNCVNGQAFIQDCGPGTTFNSVIQACDFAYNTGCQIKDKPKEGQEHSSLTPEEYYRQTNTNINQGNREYILVGGKYLTLEEYYAWLNQQKQNQGNLDAQASTYNQQIYSRPPSYAQNSSQGTNTNIGPLPTLREHQNQYNPQNQFTEDQNYKYDGQKYSTTQNKCESHQNCNKPNFAQQPLSQTRPVQVQSGSGHYIVTQQNFPPTQRQYTQVHHTQNNFEQNIRQPNQGTYHTWMHTQQQNAGRTELQQSETRNYNQNQRYYPPAINQGYNTTQGQQIYRQQNRTDNTRVGRTDTVQQTSKVVAKCPSGFTGLLPHPTICEKFLNCANGGTFIQDCGPGTVFNPDSKVCDWPYNVKCKTKTQASDSNQQTTQIVSGRPFGSSSYQTQQGHQVTSQQTGAGSSSIHISPGAGFSRPSSSQNIYDNDQITSQTSYTGQQHIYRPINRTYIDYNRQNIGQGTNIYYTQTQGTYKPVSSQQTHQTWNTTHFNASRQPKDCSGQTAHCTNFQPTFPFTVKPVPGSNVPCSTPGLQGTNCQTNQQGTYISGSRQENLHNQSTQNFGYTGQSSTHIQPGYPSYPGGTPTHQGNYYNTTYDPKITQTYYPINWHPSKIPVSSGSQYFQNQTFVPVSPSPTAPYINTTRYTPQIHWQSSQIPTSFDSQTTQTDTSYNQTFKIPVPYYPGQFTTIAANTTPETNPIYPIYTRPAQIPSPNQGSWTGFQQPAPPNYPEISTNTQFKPAIEQPVEPNYPDQQLIPVYKLSPHVGQHSGNQFPYGSSKPDQSTPKSIYEGVYHQTHLQRPTPGYDSYLYNQEPGLTYTTQPTKPILSKNLTKHWPPPFPSTDTSADYYFEDSKPTAGVKTAKPKWKSGGTCGEDEFECLRNQCIPSTWVCDGNPDCSNGFDEKNCTIYLEHFKVLPNTRLYKHEIEKWLNTDLQTCANYCLNSKNFQCKSFNFRRDENVCLLSNTNIGLSGAIAASQQYDYYEMKNFTVNCTNMYKCSNKKCINYTQVCDGNDDCGNRMDEKSCSAKSLGYELRLAGSKLKHEGRVEVKIFNEWGYICDDQFGLRDADVICKELGFHQGALQVKTSSYFAKDINDNETFYLMDDVSCFGNETSLRNCDFSGWGVHNCMPQEIAGVICKTPQENCPAEHWKCDTNNECIPLLFLCDITHDCSDRSDEASQHCEAPIEVRLANGTSKNEGRVEIRYHGVWGTICDDDFTDLSAKVVCRFLGFDGNAVVKKEGAFGPGSGPIWLDQVSCLGNESAVQECLHWNWGENNCDHNEDVGVVCTNIDISGYEKASKSKDVIHMEHPNPAVVDSLYPVKCGLTGEDLFFDDNEESDVHFRVVKGTAAKRGAYPWQATIRVRAKTKSSHWCGAVIISNKYILTAAHCLVGFSKGAYLVRAGDYDIDVDEGTEVEAFIEDFFIHERFRQGGHMNNDIALVRLKNAGLRLSKTVQPICLPEKDAIYRKGMNCTISGFGSTESGKSTSSHILRAGWVPIRSQETCRQPHVYNDSITDGMFCAGSLDEGVDSCDGDSGGPLACLDKGLFTLYGLTSWGQRCGLSNKPGVYVKISHYRDWIDTKIQESS